MIVTVGWRHQGFLQQLGEPGLVQAGCFTNPVHARDQDGPRGFLTGFGLGVLDSRVPVAFRQDTVQQRPGAVDAVGQQDLGQ